MHKITIVLLSVGLAVPVTAAEKRFDPEARAKAIASYLDVQTIALAHVDVRRVNVERLAALVADIGGLFPEEVTPLQQAAQTWITAFQHAGGKEIYLLASAEELPQPFSVVVPLDDAADAASLQRLLGGPRSVFETIAKVDHAVFAGSKAALARVCAGKPTPRPEVAHAFAAAGDTAAQLLLLPTADIRRVLEEIVPTLPNAVGGGPSTILTHGFLWAAVSLDGPPKTSLRLVIQSQDAASARSFRAVLERVSQAFVQSQQVQRSLPHADKLLPLLVPSLTADRLSLRLDPSEQSTARLLAALAPLATQGARRHQCANNLKQILLALHNYHSTYGRFPAQANFDAHGKALLSWRVHILPFLGAEKLYKEFHLDEPWDSAHNQQLIARMPAAYRCPSMKRSLQNQTTYLGLVSKSAMFTGTPEGVPIKDVADGTSNTLFIVDADDAHAVIWTKPEDLKYNPKNPRQGLVGHHDDQIVAAFVDASVRFLPVTIDDRTLLALFTRNGGERVTVP